MPVSVAARSKAYVCGRSSAATVVSNLFGGHICSSIVSVVCCQVEIPSDELITRPKESSTVLRRCV